MSNFPNENFYSLGAQQFPWVVMVRKSDVRNEMGKGRPFTNLIIIEIPSKFWRRQNFQHAKPLE